MKSHESVDYRILESASQFNEQPHNIFQLNSVSNDNIKSPVFLNEFHLNSLPESLRNLLTKKVVLEEISCYSGASLTVEGTYIPPEEKGKFVGVQPLQLILKANKKQNIDRAIQRIKAQIQQIMNLPKYKEKVLIGLEMAPSSFDVRGKVLGPGGANLQYITNETGAIVTLRGRGSGFIEPTTGVESIEPLHLCVEHNKYDVLQGGRQLAFNLIETVQQEWYNYQQHQSAVGSQQLSHSVPPQGGVEGSAYQQVAEYKGGRFRSSNSLLVEGKGGSRGRKFEIMQRGDDREVKRWDILRPRDQWKGRPQKKFGWERRSRFSEKMTELAKQNQNETATIKNVRRTKSRWDSAKIERGTDKTALAIAVQQKILVEQKLKEGSSGQPTVEKSTSFDLAQKTWEEQVNRASTFMAKEEELMRQLAEMRKNREEALQQTRQDVAIMNQIQENTVYTNIRNQVSPYGNQEANAYNSKRIEITEERFTASNVMSYNVLQEKQSKMYRNQIPEEPLNQSRINQDQHSSSYNRSSQVKPVSRPPSVIHESTVNTSFNSSGRLASSSQHSYRFSAEDYSDSDLGNCGTYSKQQVHSAHSALQYRETEGSRNLPSHFTRQNYPSNSRFDFPPNNSKLVPNETNDLPTGTNSYSANIFPQDFNSDDLSDDERNYNDDDDSVANENVSYQQEHLNTNYAKTASYNLTTETKSYDLDYNKSHKKPVEPENVNKRDDGQELYSPDFPLDDPQTEVQISQNSPGRVTDRTYKYCVAIMDKECNKLLFNDVEEIKSLLNYAQLSVHVDHYFHPLGLCNNDFLYVIELESMKEASWYIELDYLIGDKKTYNIFMYEDMLKKHKIFTKIPLKLLYPGEASVVILEEIGRHNKGLTPKEWTIIKEKYENNTLFILLEVDNLSLIFLKKLKWNLFFRDTFISFSLT